MSPSTLDAARRRRAAFLVPFAGLFGAALLGSCATADAPVGTADSSSAARAPAVAPEVAGDPMGVVVRKLPNGLTLLLSPNHEEPRIECWITTRAGSAKDPADATGMAHYLEHMNFKGTSTLGTTDWMKEKPHLDRITALYESLFSTTGPDERAAIYKQIDAESQAASAYEVPNELDTLYDSFGFRGLNAFTSDDQTSYTVNIPANRLESWATVEAERFRDPVYRLFQSEIEAVYEEKNRGMDNKGRVSHEALRAALFPQHPYGTQPTLGTIEHLKNPPLTKMYEFHRRWYVPGNMVVALAGDFDVAEAIAVVEKHLGHWEPKEFPSDPVHAMPAPKGRQFTEIKYEAEEEVQLGWITVGETHPDHDALLLADMMLDNNRTGLVNLNLGQTQATLAASASNNFLLDSGYEVLTGIPKKGQTLEEVEALLLEQVALLKKGEFTDADLAAVVTDFEIREKRELESNRARVAAMTDSYLAKKPWEWRVRLVERLRAMKKEDVVRAANKYFGPDFVAIYRRQGRPELPKIPKPGFTPVKIEPGRHSERFRTLAAMPATPLEPKFLEKGRDYVEATLPTGSLIAAKNPMNDLFQITFSIETGTDNDPRLGMGLALLDFGGAGGLDDKAFQRKLYAMGTSIGAGAGRQETSISVEGLESRLEESLALLHEHFQAPTGAGQEDLDLLVARTIEARAKQKIQPPVVARALTQYALRGADSDSLVQPRNEELKTWKAEDLLASARSVWGLRRTVLYVGTRSAEEFAKVLGSSPLGSGEVKDVPPRKPVTYVVPEKPRVLLVSKQAAQSQVGLYFPDGTYDRESVPLHRFYDEYMGGSMGSVVFQEIRESRSLAYSAGSAYRDAGWKGDSNLFLGALGTQADKTLEASEVLLQIVKEMPAAEARKANVSKSLDEGYRTGRTPFRAIPGSVLSWRRQGIDSDPRPWNWERVRNVKLEDLVAFAARWKTVPYTLTIVGDTSRFDRAKLESFGEVVEMQPDQLFAW
jgi:predicted Zn-dependent peptidase